MVSGVIVAAPAQAQRLPPTITQPQGGGSVPVTNGDDDVQKQQAIAANEQRRVEIRRDTEKMVELTQELKDYLEKNQQGSIVSLDAIKKAEQIEKLAHSVKTKIKQSF
jgi:hypothetical protein